MTRMLEAIELNRFRGFRELRLGTLSRINLISGRNNTGKTAVLESIFLLMGPLQPQLATSFSHRGEGSTSSSALPVAMRFINEWRALFFDRAIDTPITIACERSGGLRETLAILLRTASVQLIPPGDAPESPATPDRTTTQEPNLELVYRFTGSDGVTAETVATRSGIRMGGFFSELLKVTTSSQAPLTLPKATFLGTDRQPRSLLAEQFSRLRDQGDHLPIEQILRRLEPRLRSVEIRVDAQQPELAADIGMKQLVPLRMMGEGITRLVEILLNIFRTSGGIVLVDEIENGLHYSVLAEVWEAVMAAARGVDVQLFATTHSFECITAAHQAAQTVSPYELRLHRLDRINGDVSVTSYDRDLIDASSVMGLEVR